MKVKVEVVVDCDSVATDTEEIVRVEAQKYSEDGDMLYIKDLVDEGEIVGISVAVEDNVIVKRGEMTQNDLARLGEYLLDNFPDSVVEGRAAADIAIDLLQEYKDSSL